MNHQPQLDNLSAKPDIYYIQSRSEMLPFIPQEARTILDVGCGTGSFGEQLKRRVGTEIWGIELNADSAQQARTKIDKVLTGDVAAMLEYLPTAHFDCAVFNDVLEHLIDPYSVLLKIKDKLSAKGVIVCSIPNIRYIVVLKNLLLHKDWQYEDNGILDKTHLRFFTKKSILSTLKTLGYEIIRIQGINVNTSKKLALLNILTGGFFDDTKYPQFALVARPK